MLASKFVRVSQRVGVLRRLGMPIGERVNIEPGCWFSGRDVSLGDDCYVNYFCQFDEFGSITVGAGTEFATEVFVNTSTHEIGPPEHRVGRRIVKAVVIGRGCWIGTRATVMPGVTIGDGCVIAAGAVVVRDCEPNGLYGGVPARRIRDL